MKSFLIIGMGRFGRHLAAKMQEMGNDVMVVDKDRELIEMLAGRYTECRIGDCTQEPVVAALGVENFDVCFVTIGEDFQASLVVTSLLRDHGARSVVSKTKQDVQEKLLKELGADEVVYPEREMAERLAVRYNSDSIFDFIPISGDAAMYEISIPRQWVGGTIRSIDVRKRHNVNIVAIKQGVTLRPAPSPDYAFKEGDHIIVLGSSGDVYKLTSRS